jgi:hypothetical protein
MVSESQRANARARAESRMQSTCLIRRPAGKEWNTTTADYDTTYDTVYDGKCWLKLGGIQPSDAELGNQILTRQVPVLGLPVDGTEDVQGGDELLITGSLHDVALIGVEGVISGVSAQTFAATRRFTLEVMT